MRHGNQFNVDAADLAHPLVELRDRLSPRQKRQILRALDRAERTVCLRQIAPALRMALDPETAPEIIPARVAHFAVRDAFGQPELLISAWSTAVGGLPQLVKAAVLPAVDIELARLHSLAALTHPPRPGDRPALLSCRLFDLQTVRSLLSSH